MYKIPRTIANPYFFSFEKLASEMDHISELISEQIKHVTYYQSEEEQLRNSNNWIERSPDLDGCELTAEANEVQRLQRKFETRISNLTLVFERYDEIFQKTVLSRESELAYNLQ